MVSIAETIDQSNWEMTFRDNWKGDASLSCTIVILTHLLPQSSAFYNQIPLILILVMLQVITLLQGLISGSPYLH